MKVLNAVKRRILFFFFYFDVVRLAHYHLHATTRFPSPSLFLFPILFPFLFFLSFSFFNLLFLFLARVSLFFFRPILTSGGSSLLPRRKMFCLSVSLFLSLLASAVGSVHSVLPNLYERDHLQCDAKISFRLY